MARKKWEYCEATIVFDYEEGFSRCYSDKLGFDGGGYGNTMNLLNSVGHYGWELVGVSGTNYIFKRELDN